MFAKNIGKWQVYLHKTLTGKKLNTIYLEIKKTHIPQY